MYKYSLQHRITWVGSIILPILLATTVLVGCDETVTPDYPTVTFEDLIIEEGNVEKPIFIPFRLDKPYSETISIVLSTEDSTAVAGEDYQGLNGFNLQFEPGDLSKELEIRILGETDFEDNEVFFIKIDASQNVEFEKETIRVELQNEDPNTELVIPTEGYTSPTSYEGMNLIWEEDFATEIDPNTWTYEFGGSGWGNNESQYYTDENAYISEGNLVIEARKEAKGGRAYTSSRMITKDKFEFQYGRVDVRAVLPYGQGIWPAIWMLGANFSEVGWPRCGEIDIMEMIGGNSRENTVHGTLHWQGVEAKADFGGSYTTSTNGAFQNEFHVYSITWDANSINWYIDGQTQPFHSINITQAQFDEFRESFFFILNVAVGGNWPGYPNASTVFPQRMIVDYIRVFQNQP